MRPPLRYARSDWSALILTNQHSLRQTNTLVSMDHFMYPNKAFHRLHRGCKIIQVYFCAYLTSIGEQTRSLLLLIPFPLRFWGLLHPSLTSFPLSWLLSQYLMLTQGSCYTSLLHFLCREFLVIGCHSVVWRVVYFTLLLFSFFGGVIYFIAHLDLFILISYSFAISLVGDRLVF